MLKRGLFAIAASSLLFTAAHAHSQVLTLEELRIRCHDMAGNSQIMPFNTTFTCSEERTFWVKTGEQPIPLPNGSEILIRAQIKDGMHGTEWWSIPVESAPQVGRCEAFEQWRSIARTAVTVTSCAAIDEIINEAEYCKQALFQVWNDCDAERAQFMDQGAPFAGVGGACEYAPTGVVKGCVPQVPVEPCPAPLYSLTSSSSLSSHCSPTSSISSVSSIEAPEPLTPESISSGSSSPSSSSFRGIPVVPACPPMDVPPPAYELGAPVQYVGAGKPGGFHKKGFELQADPTEGSALAWAQLKKGDMIYKVNHKAVKNEKDLREKLEKARKSGKRVKISVRKSDGSFEKRDV